MLEIGVPFAPVSADIKKVQVTESLKVHIVPFNID